MIINQQRRYLHAFREARRLLDQGAIGAPIMFTAAIQDWDLMERDTHRLDMFRFFANDQPARWVMGQARCTGAKCGYGHVMEEHAVAYLAFSDGTRGLLDGGVGFNGEAALRLTGTAGIIDLFHDGRLHLVNTTGWQDGPTRSTLHCAKPGFESEDPWQAILRALLSWLEGGPPPEVAAENGIKSSELYLAAYEAAKRRDRIDLPLGAQSSFPLHDLAPLIAPTL